jgi:hypothetical protein
MSQVELNRLFSSQDSILLDKQQDMIISLLPAGANVRARACVRACVLYAVVAHGFLLLCRGRDGLSKGCGWATDVSLGLSQSG